MTIIISLILLVSLLPLLTFTVYVGIGNSTEAKPHSRPYMVSVQLDGKHICGGFLITEQFVLTAAHCWNRRENLTVVAGAHDLRHSNSSDRIEVESYVQHPSYMPGLFWNDIMLFKLTEKVALNSHVKWISIPKKGEDVEADTLCSVVGWKTTLKMNDRLSDHLMETNVSIINNTECKNKWGENYFDSQMMCIRGDGGSCQVYYNSGSPLVCGDAAVGIISFVDLGKCNSPTYPNVYTKISPYRKWINLIIGYPMRNSHVGNFSNTLNVSQEIMVNFCIDKKIKED